MNDSRKEKILKEFEKRYSRTNSKLLKGIRELLTTPAGVLLVSGQLEWLEYALEKQE